MSLRLIMKGKYRSMHIMRMLVFKITYRNRVSKYLSKYKPRQSITHLSNINGILLMVLSLCGLREKFYPEKSSTPRKVLPREKVYPGKSLPRKKSTILIQSSCYWRNLKHSIYEYFHQVS